MLAMLRQRFLWFPLWVWLLLVIAIGFVVFRKKGAKGGDGSSTLENLTDVPIMLLQWPSDVWTTTTNTPATTSTGNTTSNPRTTTSYYSAPVVPAATARSQYERFSAAKARSYGLVYPR